MKSVLILFLITIFSVAYSQDSVKIISVKGGMMSDSPFAIHSSEESILRYEFSKMDKDMRLELSLWESGAGNDCSLSKIVIFNEELRALEKPRVDLLVEQDGVNMNIRSIFAGKVIVVTPVKAKSNQIQAFAFYSKPRATDINMPLVLFIDSEKKFTQNELEQTLANQDINNFSEKIVKDLKNHYGEIKILTYHLTPLQ